MHRSGLLSATSSLIQALLCADLGEVGLLLASFCSLLLGHSLLAVKSGLLLAMFAEVWFTFAEVWFTFAEVWFTFTDVWLKLSVALRRFGRGWFTFGEVLFVVARVWSTFGQVWFTSCDVWVNLSVVARWLFFAVFLSRLGD